ncbi:MAG: MATE family efflux transporter [Thermoplasmata archaeon HGW-Thermoplasmata-1]|nr:MAG: MATE family efflux transporter [Thermoplasmata archaeon HGW-Thermoplasmata-1]
MPKPDDAEKNNPHGMGGTHGVRTLLGEPKKAILRLSAPMILAMSANTLYNLADAIWVSGLGPDALSAVGFFFPFFFILMALATGLGVGSGAAISRKIGANDKEGADRVAAHSFVLMAIVAALVSAPFIIFTRQIFVSLGAGDIAEMAIPYARIMFCGSILVFFNGLSNSLLRSEGDAKRAMVAMVVGSVLNIGLDPLFIYTFNLGVAGAAWATLASMLLTSLLLAYWLFVKRSTYISVRFRGFRFDRRINRDIFGVGLPASIQQLAMSLTMLALNLMVVRVGGTDGIAIYTTGWRVIMIGTLPLMGIATAVVSVSGAAFGSRAMGKLDEAYRYAIRMGVVIEVVLAIVIFALAPQITSLFTQAEGGERLVDGLVRFLRITCIFYPGVAFGMLSSSLFQGIGKGINALIVTLFRTIILTIALTSLFAFVLDMGLTGIWIGLVTANLLGSAAGFCWARLHIRYMKREFPPSCIS